MMHKLLIVEYRKSLKTLYEDELREDGYHILFAGNEKEALNITQQECPDLVILSGEVVLLEGISFSEKLKRYCPNILILVNTADLKACENLLHSSDVPVDCIVKSSDLDLLKRRIKDTLTRDFSPIVTHGS